MVSMRKRSYEQFDTYFCNLGDQCRFCHLHPVTAPERRQQPSKGYTKEQRVEKQGSLSAEDRRTIERRLLATSAMQKDFTGIYHLGQLAWTSVGGVSVSVLSVGRNVERATECARDVEEQFLLDPGTASVLLNYDFKNPSHYEPSSAQGREALYDGIAIKILPLLARHHRFAQARWHIILEDDCRLCLKFKREAQARSPLNELVEKFSDAPLCFLGYYGAKEQPHKAPPRCGTQMWAVRSDYLMTLAADMRKTKSCDLDMYLMFKWPGEVAALSASIAGQGSHQSDCNPEGRFFNQWLVPPQAIGDLTTVTLEPSFRDREWQAYVERDDLFRA